MSSTTNNPSMLALIEHEFNVKYPALFLQIERDGNLNWGKPGEDWYGQVYPVLRMHPPFLLFAKDFKLLAEDQFRKVLIQFRSSWDTAGKFLPFGKNAAGDYFACACGPQAELEFICRLSKRTDCGLILARNLEDFIFQELLYAACDVDYTDIEEYGMGEFINGLQRMLKSHQAYLSKSRFDILETIYRRPLQEFDNETGMISCDDFYALQEKHVECRLEENKFSYRQI